MATCLKMPNCCNCLILALITLKCLFSFVKGTYPTVQSHGQPWPMPRMYEPSSVVLSLNVADFEFRSVGEVDCDILRDAYVRYNKLTFGGFRKPKQNERYLQKQKGYGHIYNII